MLRGVWSHDYNLVLVAQIGIAIGQPFILNAITTVAARWFPIRERATASGLGSLAMYLGIFLGLILTPFLWNNVGIVRLLLIYGVVAVIAAIAFFIFARERPATPPCPPGMEVRSLAFEGFKKLFRQKNFIFLMIIFFIGLGAFNAVTTWIEDIVRPNGFSSTQAGIIGGLMILGGIIGALVLPTLSDRFRNRTTFIILALSGAILGLAGITFATTYWLLLTASFILGFFLLSAGPIGFQYGAETTHPTPEGTSNGLLLLMGQISGIVFIFAMDAFRSATTGSMSNSLIALIGLLVLSLGLAFFLKEPKFLLIGQARPAPAPLSQESIP